MASANLLRNPMQPYGTDRLRPGKGDQLILFCSRPKGWVARIEKTLTTARHPGTAVVWEERIFEVVAASPGPNGGVRYALEPWHDEHIIRVSESYDAESEARREAEYFAAIAREKQRKVANFGALVTGLLPSNVQEHLASELGLLAAKLTAISCIGPTLFVAWVVSDFVRRYMDPNQSKTPVWLILAAGYFVLESLFRFYVAWFHRRPLGSVAGLIAYLPYWAIRVKRAVSPFAEQRGEKLFITQPPEDVALQDAYAIREPLLTLLSPGEQHALAERFGFDYRKDAPTVAVVILVVAAIGVISSVASLPRFSALVSLLVAGALGVEQVIRIGALQRGPAGSVLAVVVRPFARKLLR